MTYDEIKKAATDSLAWLETPAGRHELALLAEKYGFSDGWFIVYAMRKVAPDVTRYEDICAVVEELRIIRRTPAIAMRVWKEKKETAHA